MKLLLIEDDAAVAGYLVRALKGAGHAVDHAADGRAGLSLARGEAFDVILLDRMLPLIDGLSVLRALRADGAATPILILTSLNGIDDRVEGLEAGGDDYLVKPFAFPELLARVNALARRSPPQDAPMVLEAGDLRLDILKRAVTRGGKRVDLQPREFQLLEYLMRHAGRTVTRTMLLESVWDLHFDPRTNIVETHISRLRGKIAQRGDPELIHTVRGTGYCLRAPE